MSINTVSALVGLMLLSPVFSTVAAQPKLQCNVGPVHRLFGKTPWLVYSCNDHSTVVIVAAPTNPAMPFYFTLHMKNGAYQVDGEGKAYEETKEITDSAYNELKALSTDDINKLIQETASDN